MDKLKKTFNSTTTTGRANVAKVTYASFAFLYLYYRFFKKNKTTPAIQAHEKSSSEKQSEDEYKYNQTDACPSCEDYSCQKSDPPPPPPSCNEPNKNPFPDQTPNACPPRCDGEPAPNLPLDDGQCTCRFVMEGDCNDPERRSLNPFLNDIEDDEIW